ncbi:MAG: helicase [Nitrososphaerota archaeon]
MARFTCPLCRGPVRFALRESQGLLAFCGPCSLGTASGAEDEEEAYLELLEAVEGGKARKGNLQGLLEAERLLMPLQELERLLVREGITLGELPNDVRELLLSRQDLIVKYELLAAHMPKGGEVPEDLPRAFREAALRAGLRPYPFQVEAWRNILAGKNTLILAPAGSGKTEAFALPALYLGSLAQGRPSVLFIYPTKALGRDQRPRLAQLAEAMGMRVQVMDGDTPEDERRRIAEDPPHAIITNFDAIHYHLLYRTPFGRLLPHIRVVALDEVQVYKGVYGAHVHFILRRLRRVTRGLQLIAASALLENPVEFVEKLCAAPFELVKEETGRRGPAHLIAIMPVLRGYHEFFVRCAELLLRHRRNLLLFFNSHRNAELVALMARRRGLRVEVHRAGLPAAHRERVEKLFKGGELRAIAATPTLELGLDVGTVDGVASELVVVNRLVQRVGRAGRRGQESAVVLVLRPDDPIGQYYRRNFDQYFADVEAAYLEPGNPYVAERQLLAMALEKLLLPEEARGLEDVLRRLLGRGLLRARGMGWEAVRPGALRELSDLNLRGTGEAVRIYVGGRRAGERELPLALEELHPGAVYLMNGRPYLCRELDLKARRAALEPMSGEPYFTRAIVEEEPRVLRVLESKGVLGLTVLYAELALTKRVVGYMRRTLGEAGPGTLIPLPEAPTYSFRTRGLVFRAPRPLRFLERRSEEGLWEGSSYHASEHALIEGTDMITGGAAEEMGGLSLGASGIILVYDAAPGGSGPTYLLFNRMEAALRRAYEVVSRCPCASLKGCPRCVYSYRCGNDNRFLSREGAEEVLRRILEGEGRGLEPDEVGGWWRS